MIPISPNAKSPPMIPIMTSNGCTFALPATMNGFTMLSTVEITNSPNRNSPIPLHIIPVSPWRYPVIPRKRLIGSQIIHVPMNGISAKNVIASPSQINPFMPNSQSPNAPTTPWISATIMLP